jgi:hypothetical protein
LDGTVVEHPVVTVGSVRALAVTLPRTTEALVHGRVKFRVGRLVYLAFSRDGSELGFAFPKEERDGLVAGAPDRFLLPRPSEMRWNWVVARTAALDPGEAAELVVDAWRFVVPRRVAVGWDEAHPAGPEPLGGPGGALA